MTRTSYVWRVQDEHGCGPYGGRRADGCKHRPAALELSCYRDDVCVNPSPFMDGLPRHKWPKGGGYVFAFPSLYALFNWFDADALRFLRRYGYVPRKLRVSEMIVSTSGRQCIAKLAK